MTEYIRKMPGDYAALNRSLMNAVQGGVPGEREGAVMRPCPFCGQHMTKVTRNMPERETTGWSVICDMTDCLTYGPLADTEDEAVAAWNRRSYTQT